MVPISIVQTKTGKFDEEGFKNYLLDICKKHKEQGRALAFAFIVYDFEDDTIQGILDNKIWWTSLDKISGHYLSIFYINTQDSYFKRRQQEIYEDEIASQDRAASRGFMQWMRPITLQSTPLDKTVDFLKMEFKLEKDLKHPFVLFFQTDGELILDYFAVTLKQEKLEDAFHELKRQIKTAVEAIVHVAPHEFGYHQEIFSLIEAAVSNGNYGQIIKTEVIPRIGIGSIFSLVKFIGGGANI
jgi:hypothetical protein